MVTASVNEGIGFCDMKGDGRLLLLIKKQNMNLALDLGWKGNEVFEAISVRVDTKNRRVYGREQEQTSNTAVYVIYKRKSSCPQGIL